MELELKHLAPYLPYKLIIREYDSEFDLAHFKDDELTIKLLGEIIKDPLSTTKAILRPLSDLTIDWYWSNLLDSNFAIDEVKIKEMKELPLGHLKYYQIMFLTSHHFDIFGLIKKGLAIDINKI